MRRSALVVAGSLALLFLLLSLLTPVLPGSLTSLSDPVLSVTCHRLPGRCIDLPWGESGLCARCTAFWGGLAVTAAAVLVAGRSPVGPAPAFLMLLPMVVDGSMQHLHVYESPDIVRIATGVLCGAGLAFLAAALSSGRG
jgi:uncharacterized membrane protein